MSDIAIKIENLKKQYRLGTISNSTLNAEVQSWWARVRGKEDPNAKLGQASDGRKVFNALDGINLEIKKGEAIGIIGSNGAGKSTLLKILARVTAPTEGDVWINGRISSMLEVGTGFHGEMTGRENIYMNGAILGMTKKEVDAKIESIIEFSECREFIDTPVKRYSSGMYVKLAFAVAAHLDSEILIMDEVLAVGDVRFQKKCLGKMGDVAEHEGKTILYVSHNMATIRRLCTRCIVLRKGKIVFDGDVSRAIEIYSEADSDISSAFIDNRQKNRGTEIDRLGTKMMINRARFLNKDLLAFNTDEKVQAEVEIESFSEQENIFMGLVYYGMDDEVVGLEYVRIPNMKTGDVKTLLFETSFENLPFSKYKMHFTLFGQNELGVWDRSLDQTDNVTFSLEAKDVSLEWRRDWFGVVDFNNLKLLK